MNKGKALHVASSPLTGRVYCGNVLKSGDTWGANKTDVTGEACAAVAQHVLLAGGKTTVTRNGQPAYELLVRELPANVGGEARLAAHQPPHTTTATPQGVASTDELERR